MTKAGIATALASIWLAAAATAEETPFTHESFDGYRIEARLALPEGVAEGEVERVVILLGGSGAYDMDLDLTTVSRDKATKNLWLKEVSDALVAGGFGTIRYNKRPFQLGVTIQAVKAAKREPTEEERAVVKRYQDNPLKAIVDDCKSFAEAAEKRFPKAKILLLGASEGTHVALWAAHELKQIDGVALIGFYARSLDTTTYEQMVHRDQYPFRELDKDGDGDLTKDELKSEAPSARTLLLQFAALDIDGDGRLSLMEYKAACLVAWAKSGDVGDAYRRQEAAYPAMFDILKESDYPVVFLQGMWDNQTPACNAMAAEVLARYVWKKDTLTFRYFPKLGHCLDPRESENDLLYSRIDADAAKAVVAEMDKRFR